MARKKSEFLSAYGVAFQVLKSITDAVLAEGGSDEDLRSLLSDSEKCRRVAMEIVGHKPREQKGTSYRGDVSPAATGFRAEVIYVQPSYADLKKVFDCVYDGYKNAEFKPIDICKDVSVENREIEFELVHLNKDVSTDKALAELDKQGLCPALYEELLAFAAKYPELQKQFPIVALGSVCRYDDDLYSPYVRWNDVERDLDFYWIDDGWCDRYRFLAVRKQPSA